jgi:hypothetical protein
LSGRRAILAIAAGMLLFLHASRLALMVFDPYLSSRALAEALVKEPAGKLIINGAYYPFSSLLFYADRDALLLNGRFNNLEYGSYAPGAPKVFIDDAQFTQMWTGAERCYLVSDDGEVERLGMLTENRELVKLTGAGGKSLYTNYVLNGTPAANQENAGHHD